MQVNTERARSLWATNIGFQLLFLRGFLVKINLFRDHGFSNGFHILFILYWYSNCHYVLNENPENLQIDTFFSLFLYSCFFTIKPLFTKSSNLWTGKELVRCIKNVTQTLLIYPSLKPVSWSHKITSTRRYHIHHTPIHLDIPRMSVQ